MVGPVSLSSLPNLSIQTEMRPGVRLGKYASSAAPSGVSGSFSEFLEAKIQETNQLQVEADQVVSSVATGKSHNLHEMMIALDRADVSFRLMTKVRNKAVEAYQEVMRMQF
jgi:flagellar hook-basal body complex protein FliE